MGASQPKPEAAEGEDDYQHIDTGDSLKVKQILDEATVKAVLAKGYDEDEANQRMDVIGQNGPTGEHYDKNQTELEL